MRRCLQCSRSYDDAVQFCPSDGTALPPPDTLIGRIIGDKYRIDALQGVGGMGAVYRATQLSLERTVALKIVKGDFLSDVQVTERFKREALAVGRLNHANVVTVFDFGILSDVGAYLVMEFLQGRTLREELKEHRHLEYEQAIQLMEQACSAVYAAHVEGVIHRDLKPDNIFLQATVDGSISTKILDFGVAKFCGVPDPIGTDLTVTGMIIGTPVYMSPEQCKGEELDPRSDIYSLGCVFYELLAGRPPFTGGTSSALVVKHASEAPKPLSTFAPNVPPLLEAAVLKALAKQPDDRFATAAEFGETIRAAWESTRTPGSSAGEVVAALLVDGTGEQPSAASEKVGELVEHLFPSQTDDGRRRLAVVPFKNLMNDESVDFLGFALADSLITELSGEPGLLVRPSSAVAQYTDSTPEPRVLSEQLEVDYLIHGSFLKEGDAFQLSVQLVDLAANAVVWQQRINTTYTNTITLQVEVGDQVVSGVCAKLGLGPDGASSGARTPTATPGMSTNETPMPEVARDPVALELFERASGLGDGAEERDEAIGLLERSVALDPDNATAWSALAARHYDAAAQIYVGSDHTEKALRAAERALAVDREQLGSVVALGRLLVEVGQAEELARRATAMINERPDSFAARFALGYAFRFGGLLDRALREFRLVEQFDAASAAQEVATIYLQKQLYEDALRVLENVRVRVPSLFLHTVARVLSGEASAARETTDEMMQMDRHSVFTLMGQVLVRHLEGQETEPLLVWLREIDTGNCEVHCWLAQVHAFAGDDAGAVDRLRRAVASGYFNAPYMASDPLLEPARANVEIQAIIDIARRRHEQFKREFE
jgi:serine/threonine protein kinase